MGKTAIILGASGATGNELLKLLLQDDRYDKIKLFLRSEMEIVHPKIEAHIIDLFKLEEYKEIFTGDEVYCCIGTTKTKTPDKETYYKIDYGIPATAALLAKQNGIDTFIVISALGVNKDSTIFYMKTKAEMQEAVLNQNIVNTYVLQPSLITAQRKDNHIMEKLASVFMGLINPLLFGNAAKYKSIKAKTIAKVMLWLGNNKYPEIIITSDKIQEIADTKN